MKRLLYSIYIICITHLFTPSISGMQELEHTIQQLMENTLREIRSKKAVRIVLANPVYNPPIMGNIIPVHRYRPIYNDKKGRGCS